MQLYAKCIKWHTWESFCSDLFLPFFFFVDHWHSLHFSCLKRFPSLNQLNSIWTQNGIKCTPQTEWEVEKQIWKLKQLNGSFESMWIHVLLTFESAVSGLLWQPQDLRSLRDEGDIRRWVLRLFSTLQWSVLTKAFWLSGTSELSLTFVLHLLRCTKASTSPWLREAWGRWRRRWWGWSRRGRWEEKAPKRYPSQGPVRPPNTKPIRSWQQQPNVSHPRCVWGVHPNTVLPLPAVS